MTSNYTPYKAKMRVYGHISSMEGDGNLYSNPIHPDAYSVREDFNIIVVVKENWSLLP